MTKSEIRQMWEDWDHLTEKEIYGLMEQAVEEIEELTERGTRIQEVFQDYLATIGYSKDDAVKRVRRLIKNRMEKDAAYLEAEGE